MILSGGGTAGHIYPALALADELRSREIDLTYVGTAAGPEARLVPQVGLDFVSIKTAGFDRARPHTLVTSGIKALIGVFEALRLIEKQKPSAVICFGGYVSVPIGLAARIKKIPLVIHEQNSYMGMTNRFLAKRANFIALTYPETKGIPSEASNRTGFVGNPVRASMNEADGSRGREELGVPDSALMLLVFGGSRGARKINRALLSSAKDLLTKLPELYIVHGTGDLEYVEVSDTLEGILKDDHDMRSRYIARSYIEDMGDALAAADLVVARAGATSIAELTVLAKPSVLIPYPFATDDHQTTNAQALVDLGGAKLIADSQLSGELPGQTVDKSADLTTGQGLECKDSNTLGTDKAETTIFADTLLELLSCKNLRSEMAAQSAKLGKPFAAKQLADEVMRLVTDANS